MKGSYVGSFEKNLGSVEILEIVGDIFIVMFVDDFFLDEKWIFGGVFVLEVYEFSVIVVFDLSLYYGVKIDEVDYFWFLLFYSEMLEEMEKF